MPRRRRASEQRGLTIQITLPSDPAEAKEAARRYVTGMARLAAELLLDGAFEDEEVASDPDAMISKTLRRSE